jgi:predicted porin
MQNISSRIGFIGERSLTDDLSGVMQIETGIDPHDEVNSKAFASRNSYAGLKSKAFGTLITGKHDTPFKNLEGTASPVWGSAEAMEIIIHGKGSARVANDSKTSLFNNFHTRRTNSVQYWSPTFSNVKVRLAYSPDELNGAAGTFDAKLYGGSIEFDNNTFNAGIATETQTNYNVVKAVGYDMTGVKATAGMKFGDATVGVAYSALDNKLGKKTNNWLLSGTYKLGPTLLKANYGQSSESASGKNDGLNMLGLEVDYPLDKFTTLYGYYSSISNEAAARGRFEAGETKYSPVAGDDPNVLGLGLRYNF